MKRHIDIMLGNDELSLGELRYVLRPTLFDRYRPGLFGLKRRKRIVPDMLWGCSRLHSQSECFFSRSFLMLSA